MDMQALRIDARKCLNLAFEFLEFSPAAKKFLSATGIGVSKIPRGQRMNTLLRETLCRRLDDLILVNDPSVRIMILEAMDVIGYCGKHLGLIATFYCSEEIGYKLGRDGKKIPSDQLGMLVWRYMLHILEIPSYFNELERCANHWEGVLQIDYTKEFSGEGVSSEEVTRRITENKTEVRGFYRDAFEDLLKKKLSGYYEKRPAEVYRCLDGIFSYIFQENLDDRIRGVVLEMLARIARCGHFPEKWLLDLSQKHAA